MGMGRRVVLVAGATAIAGVAFAQQQQPQQKITGPVAVYWMSAATQTGFGLGGLGGGGGRPSMGQIMGMLGGGGGGATKTLKLDLGSSRAPQGEANAEHLPPQTLGAGQSLPLLTPKPVANAPVEREEQPDPVPREYQKPRGRMLIFWGCGEHAKPGQPVVLDFAQIAEGKIPAGMEVLSKGIGARIMQPPSPGRNKTYGGWPNEKTRVQVPGTGSLVGDHLIKGNYSPDIKFSLNQNQDFLGALNLTTNAKNPTGSGQLGWNAVSGAEAYLATAVGGGQNETVVLWSSSEVSSAGFLMPEYITPADLNRLVGTKALMGPQTTSCTVPKEVMDAAPQALVSMTAYGGEANFTYPERPKDPKIPWDIQWQVKVRYRSATGGMLGMAMPGMGGGASRGGSAQQAPPPQQGQQQGQQSQQQPSQQQPPEDPAAARRRAIMRGVGGLLGL
jgi:hypothetical protein